MAVLIVRRTISCDIVWSKWGSVSCSFMSDSLRPHGLQPTRLLHPWDFPDKHIGVGCHQLVLKIKLRTLSLLYSFFKTLLQNLRSSLLCHGGGLVTKSCPLLRLHGLQPARLLCPGNSPGKNAGVGCYFLFQCMKVKSEREVAQLCPTLCDPMDYSLPGSSVHGIFQARVLEWVAIAFSDQKSP